MSEDDPLLTREQAYTVGFYALGVAIISYISGPFPARWHLEMAALFFIIPTIVDWIKAYREGDTYDT